MHVPTKTALDKSQMTYQTCQIPPLVLLSFLKLPNLYHRCSHPRHALHFSRYNLVIGEPLPLYNNAIPFLLDGESCTQLPCHSHLQKQYPISVSSLITVAGTVTRKENMACANWLHCMPCCTL